MPDAHPGAHVLFSIKRSSRRVVDLRFRSFGLLVAVHQRRTAMRLLLVVSAVLPRGLQARRTRRSFGVAVVGTCGDLLETTAAGWGTPIISSARRFCFCSTVSYQAEPSSSALPGALAPLPVLKPCGRRRVGSMRAARSSCLGGIIIHSSRRNSLDTCGFVGGSLVPLCSSSDSFCHGQRVSCHIETAGQFIRNWCRRVVGRVRIRHRLRCWTRLAVGEEDPVFHSVVQAASWVPRLVFSCRIPEEDLAMAFCWKP